MSKATFHYEQRRLENDLVALEPFDVGIISSLNGRILLELLSLTLLSGAVVGHSRNALPRSDQSKPGSL
jgi:hypothetical protein